MRLFKSTYRDRSGKTRETAKWYVEFRDQHEITRRVSAFSNKRATEELGKNIEQLVSYHLATGGQIDPALQCWITDLPKRTRDKLVSIGLIRGERVAVTRPLREHLHDYEKRSSQRATPRSTSPIHSPASSEYSMAAASSTSATSPPARCRTSSADSETAKKA